MAMIKKAFCHSNLEMDFPYLGLPVKGHEGDLPSWRTVTGGDDDHHTIGVHCQVKAPFSNKRCFEVNGPFYVSHDFMLLDNSKVICPYCGSSLRIQKPRPGKKELKGSGAEAGKN